jgi:3-methyladenine DNA glycosylase AlkD
VISSKSANAAAKLPPKPASKPPSLAAVRRALHALGGPERAEHSLRFFKTGPGEYGEGDRFLGATVPEIRALARQFKHLSHENTIKLLRGPWHEERLLALVLMVDAHRHGDATTRARTLRDYLANTRWINNWDLVDASAREIVGAHIAEDGMRRIDKLVRSTSLWERRIAMIATHHETLRGEPAPALRIAERLLGDTHDLIHKAVGWMLREVGKRDPSALRAFLDAHVRQMPRTALRYAIERFSDEERKRYLTLW